MSMPAPDSEEIPPASAELAASVDLSTHDGDAPFDSGAGRREASRISSESPGARSSTEQAPTGWVLIALVPFDGREPPRQASDELAQAVWCAVSSLWHPALLSSARRAAADRADRIAIATWCKRDPRGRRRTLGPASFRIPNPGRGFQERAAGIGNGPGRLDCRDPRTAGSRRCRRSR